MEIDKESDAILANAEQAFKTKDYTEAIVHYRAFHEQQGGNTHTWTNQLLSLIRLENFADARVVGHQSLKKIEVSSKFLLPFLNVLFTCNYFNEAESVSLKFLHEFPKNQKLIRGLNYIYLKKQEFAKSDQLIKEISKNEKLEVCVTLMRLEHLSELGNRSKVLVFLYTIRNHSHYQVRLAVGRSFLQLREYEEAWIVFSELIEDNPDEPAAYSGAIRSLTVRNMLDEANQLTQRLSEKFPENPQGHAFAINVMLSELDFEGAADLAESRIKEFPDKIGFIRQYLNAGIQFGLESRQIQKGLAHLDGFPDNFGMQLLRAEFQVRIGDVEQAIVTYKQLLSTYPKVVDVFLGLAKCYIQTGKREDALGLINQKLSEKPFEPRLYITKVEILDYLTRHSECFESLEEAKSLFPYNQELALLEGKMRMKVFDFAAAKRLFGKLIEQNSTKIFEATLLSIHCLIEFGEYTTARKKLIEFSSDSRYTEQSLFFTLCAKCFEGATVEEWEMLADKLIKISSGGEFINRFVASLESYDRIDEALVFLDKNTFSHRHATVAFLNGQYERARLLNTLKISQKSDPSELDQDHRQFLNSIHKHLSEKFDSSEAMDLYESICKKLNVIQKKFQHTYLFTRTNPHDTLALVQYLVARIKNRIPTSLIRLGDGEGKFLPYDKSFISEQSTDQGFMQKYWWGHAPLQDRSSLRRKTLKGFEGSIENADVIGISEHRRFANRLNLNLRPPFNHEVRGMITPIDYLVGKVTKNPKKWSEKVITSAYIHHEIEQWGLYNYMFSYIESCSLVTCHKGLHHFLMNRFQLITRRNFLIPAENSKKSAFGVNEKEKHFPDRFEELIKEINVAYTGEVFLVAAGFLTKLYCDDIKRKGGIAIDIGSLADSWLSFDTRGAEMGGISDPAKLSIFKAILGQSSTSLFLNKLPEEAEAESNVFWINRDQDKDRHEHMRSILKYLGANHKRIKAIEPETLGNIVRPALHVPTETQLSCLSSHLLAIQQGILLDKDWFTICEDDLDPQDCQIPLNRIVRSAPDDWEVLQIHVTTNKVPELSRAYLAGKLWVEWIDEHYSTLIYIIRSKGGERLIRKLNVNLSDFDLSNIPYKPSADKLIYTELKTYSLTFPLVSGLDKDSSIHEDHLPFHRRNSKLRETFKIMAHMENPQINPLTEADESKQLVIGLGTGRSGTSSLSELLNCQNSTFVSHEMGGNTYRFPDWSGEKEVVSQLRRLMQIRPCDFVGDIASSYLNYVEEIIRQFPNAKFVCMVRDKAEVVGSFIKKVKGMNHWQVHDGSSFILNKNWDSKFPKYGNDLSIAQAIGKYWDDYNSLTSYYQETYEKNFRLVSTESLNNQGDIKELLKWIGYKKPLIRRIHSNQSG